LSPLSPFSLSSLSPPSPPPVLRYTWSEEVCLPSGALSATVGREVWQLLTALTTSHAFAVQPLPHRLFLSHPAPAPAHIPPPFSFLPSHFISLLPSLFSPSLTPFSSVGRQGH